MRLVMLASGQGSLVKTVWEAIRQGQLKAELALIVSNRTNSGAVEWAVSQSIRCLAPQDESLAWEDFEPTVSQKLQQLQPDLIFLAGFLKKLSPAFLKNWSNMCFNTHPSLLPRHGGNGFYGSRVHHAVIASGDTETGVSIHQVTEEYDEGPILKQARIPVPAGISAPELEVLVRECERRLVLEFLEGGPRGLGFGGTREAGKN